MYFKSCATATATATALSLILSACGGSSSTDSNVTSVVTNRAPVAKIVAEHSTQKVGGTLSLDARDSSDPEQDALSYVWQVLAPNGEEVVLEDKSMGTLELVTQQVGDYSVTLTVTDEKNLAHRIKAQISVSEIEKVPMEAVIVGLKTVKQGQYLKYSAAFSAIDWESPSYQWQLLGTPQGSSALLEQDDSLYTHFNADKAGVYQLKLIISGTGEGEQLETELQITAVALADNLPPIAKITQDKESLQPNEVLQLSAATSSDNENDDLSYTWEVVMQPLDSLLTLTVNVNEPELASFSSSHLGDYRIRLTVSDGVSSSYVDANLTVLSDNRPPRGKIETSAEFVRPGQTITLYANATDPDDDVLSFRWRLLSKPRDSHAKLNDPSAQTVEFTTDEEGDYVVIMQVDDSQKKSFPAGKTISVYHNFAPEITQLEYQKSVPTNTDLVLAISATDPESNVLTYQWEVESKPEGATASLAIEGDTTVKVNADTVGEYRVGVTATDSDGKSSRTAIFVFLVN